MSKVVGCEHCQSFGSISLKVIIDDVVCCVECKTDLSIPRWRVVSVESTLLELITKLQEKQIILPNELKTLEHNVFYE